MQQVAIVGGGKSWIRAPFGDPAWQIWSHASCFEGMQAYGVHRWYDPHTPEVRAREKTWSPRYQRWLTDPAEGRTAPYCYLRGGAPTGEPRIDDAAIFNRLEIPRDAIEAWLTTQGAVEQEYTTSTGVHMFKHALYEGATLIGIWGIDYEEAGEYLVQRPCFEHWIGFARARGVKVYVTPSSPLGRDPHVYGRDGDRPDLRHTYQPYRRGKAQRVTVLQAMGKAPMHEIPAEIQKLIDEEKSLFGIDTEAEWHRLASLR